MGIKYQIVFLAALIPFLAGVAWYHPKVWGRAWLKAHQLPAETFREIRRFQVLFSSFVMFLVMSYAMARLLPVEADTLGGLMMGLWLGLGVSSASISVNYLFLGKDAKAFLIDCLYFILVFTLMGLILGTWA